MMQDPKFNSLSAMNSQSTVKTDSKPVAKEQDPYEAMKKSPWIHAWSDSVAGVKAYSQCMKLGDLDDDGEHKLIIADMNKKIKIYKGTNVFYEANLTDMPVGVDIIYSTTKKPMIPFIAVGCGSGVFIYHKYKPYYRYKLPFLEINEEEKTVWSEMNLGSKNIAEGIGSLYELREKKVELTALSLDVLSIESEKEQEEMVTDHLGKEINQINYITCMHKLNKNMDEDKAVTYLCIGTENKSIIILDNFVANVIKTINLPCVPVKIICTGLYDVEYKIYIVARDGRIHQIKNGAYSGVMLELDSKPVGIVKLEKSIAIGGMDNTVHGYFAKGKKAFSIYLPSPIVTMILLDLKHIQTIKALVIGLQNGEVRIYNEKHLVSMIRSDEILNGMVFGNYGREEGTLILNYQSGGLTVKMLQRNAKLNVSSVKVGPPPEQDIPLNVPKKTKLFIELTQRERDQAISMHKIFQMDMSRLRLKTAQNYYKMLSDGHAPMSYTSGSQIRLIANVQGLGPLFKIRLQITNISKITMVDLPIIVTYNEKKYTLRKKTNYIPVLVPMLEYIHIVEIESIDPTGANDVVKIFICDKGNSCPLISAYVNMPISEQGIME